MRYTIGTAGHIDHGKTTLVKALTGMETDTLKEEKKRGLSINLGFAHFDAKDDANEPVSIAIVDVPGHERFIRNMLAGTTGIDAALLVVAADDGVMPQTREHAEILSLLGITSGVVAITKCDAVDAERIAAVRREITELLKGAPLEAAHLLEVSAITGAGVNALKSEIVCECLKAKRRTGGPYFRLPIDRSFAVKGFGAVVTGTIASGAVRIGDEVKGFATGQTGRVRGIESLHKAVESAASGERAAINVSGPSHNDFSRGMTLTEPLLVDYAASFSKGKFFLDCAFEFTSSDDSLFPIKDQAELKLYHQTSERGARIKFADRKKAQKGERVFGRLALDEVLLAMRGDRFILRDTSKSKTIGGGRVLLPHFTRTFLKRINETNYHCLSDFTIEKTGALIRTLFKENDLAIPVAGLDYVLNMKKSDLQAHLSAFTTLGQWIAVPEKLQELKDVTISTLADFHKKNPSAAGLDEGALYEAVRKTLRVDAALFADVVDSLVKDSKVIRQNAALKLAGARAELSPSDMKTKTAIMALFKTGINAIGDEDLKAAGNAADVKRVIAFLMQTKAITRVAEGRYVTAASLDEAKGKLIALLKARGKAGIKAAEFRDAIGAGRKLAIELLEYFDRERVTLRHGDLRTLREVQNA